jgi:hypothetical protein
MKHGQNVPSAVCHIGQRIVESNVPFAQGWGTLRIDVRRSPKMGNQNLEQQISLEVLLNDEAATMQQFDKLCGNENLFSYTRVPRRRMPVEVAPAGIVPSPEAPGEGIRVNRETAVRSKILSHFIKGKISLTPMETVLMIPGESKHLESLVKLARRKKDVEAINDQVSMVSTAPAIR